MKYWLMKSEPGEFSIDDLKNRPGGTDSWNGIRNYQARNYIREMRAGDMAFFYHSSCAVPGIAGTMQILGQARPDPTAFDESSEYFDAASDPGQPRWFQVDVKYKTRFKQVIPLAKLRRHAALRGMPVLQKGSRLSVTPVSKRQWDLIQKLA
jgi:predicted RNA-binding protein with PUA-like domain